MVPPPGKDGTLVIFDYSGTLSLQAVLFGQEASLRSAFRKSGLSLLGMTPSRFWKEIVNPTWTEGSTTRIGYKQVMCRRLREGFALQCPEKPPIDDSMLQKASADFVDLYLASSRMDEAWRPILKNLSSNRDVCTVIATDHYAEATPAILAYLAEWNIPALSAEQALGLRNHGGVIVANSADLRAHKNTSLFWQTVKSGLALQHLWHVLLVDDFGYNEQEEDAYGEKERIQTRQAQTTRLLQEVFCARLHFFPFFLERKEDPQAYGDLIRLAALFLDRFLRRNGR